MKSRILVILTIVAVVAVTVAIASQSCPIGKSDCQVICQRSGACELGEGCGIKDKDKACDKEKDKDKEKGCDKDKDKDPNSDPNSQK
jgi:hypothetical protein